VIEGELELAGDCVFEGDVGGLPDTEIDPLIERLRLRLRLSDGLILGVRVRVGVSVRVTLRVRVTLGV